MKKMFLLILFLSTLLGCSKDENDENQNQNSYLIEYSVNQNYTQTFYYGGGCAYLSPDGGHDGNWYNSICNRLTFSLYDYDNGFTTITPSKDLIKNLETLNKDTKNKELKYYLVADIHFQYVGLENIAAPQLKKSWKTVIGKMEEYVFNGKIYQHLVVVDSN